MSFKTNRSIPPEIILADRFLRHIPRSGKILKADLLTVVFKENPQEYTSCRDYFDVALEILHFERYIEINDASNGNATGTEYCLTNAGRTVQDTEGYLKRYKEKIEKEAFDKKVNTAEGKKKIFDNKVKYVLFLIVVLTAIVGLWGKRSSNVEKPGTEAQNLPKEDTFKQVQNQSKTEINSTVSDKRQPENRIVQTSEESKPQNSALFPEKKVDNNSLAASPKSTEPIQIAKADNIEFKLVKSAGNSKAQSVTFTLIFTTSAANWYINSLVKSIIDSEGNEYKLKSFTNGASDYLHSIDLVTGVPIKCTYTFGGVLPDVKIIKLFKFDYSHSAGEPFAVEFRDIPVDWQ